MFCIIEAKNRRRKIRFFSHGVFVFCCFQEGLNMDEKLRSLLEYVKADERVYPMPTLWTAFWQILIKRHKETGEGEEPATPLILPVWSSSTAEQKREVLASQIKYASDHGILDEADRFLRRLSANRWVYGEDCDMWEKWQKRKLEDELTKRERQRRFL